MLGIFQQSCLRIAVKAPQETLRQSLLKPQNFSQWLWPQGFDRGLPEYLGLGQSFTGHLGLLSLHHQVTEVGEDHLVLMLSGAVDGFHQWYWGDNWVQSRLEGVSLLPLNLSQSLTLLRLQAYLNQPPTP
ncbi:MAG: hypothetical protein VKO01_07370 [Cyanobacteriota bacterium]|nr:hypothetical protein [Cyanobacteriota bacterium]